MSKFAFWVTKTFWKKMGMVIGLYLGLAILVMISLRFYTHHKQSIPVPDFKGLTTDRVIQLAKYNKLRINVIDSIYIPYLPKGAVIDQNPQPGVGVKRNRTVFVTINATTQAKVEMPNLVGVSFRQGKTTLESRGLKVGRLIYVPDFAQNNILDQQVKGKTIEKGSLIEKGSPIDLVLGNGYGGSSTPVPNLYKMHLNQAQNLLHDTYLNLGRVTFDQSVQNYKDSLNATIYQQRPAFYDNSRVVMGSKVDIWLSVNPDMFTQTP
jgi:eukaryotic-like serine/threonine-protein kinase